MEVLFLIFAEALAAVVIAFGNLLAALVAGILASLASAMAALLGIKRERRPETSAAPLSSSNPPADPDACSAAGAATESSAPVVPLFKTPGFRRWSRRITIGVGAVTCILLLGLAILNQWYFDEVGRWVLQAYAQESGVEIQAQKLEGNIFKGRLRAGDTRVTRDDAVRGIIDLQVDALEVDVSSLGLFRTPMPVARVQVRGARGRFVRGTEKRLADSTLSARIWGRERRGVKVADLTVTGVSVTYEDPALASIPPIIVTIEQLTSKPFRSRFAVFDVLFRSNAEGSIAGQPFKIWTDARPTF